MKTVRLLCGTWTAERNCRIFLVLSMGLLSHPSGSLRHKGTSQLLHLGALTGLSRFMHGPITRSVILMQCVSRKLAHWYRNGQSPYILISFKQGHESPVEHIAFDRIHNRLATVARGSLRVWDMANNCRLF